LADKLYEVKFTLTDDALNNKDQSLLINLSKFNQFVCQTQVVEFIGGGAQRILSATSYPASVIQVQLMMNIGLGNL
jgi:hypothetical protein